MKTTFLILSVLICTISSAQINGPTVKFPSPSAAELGRFSATKVGLYTGTAQYSIPIYEFKTPNLTLPIVLDYSSNGLVVDKIGSWVGFDWSLNVGGVINRYGKGRVDKPGSRPAYQNWNYLTEIQKKSFLDNLLTGDRDLEPDEFVFTFPNHSGKFVFDEVGNPVLIPYSNLKIETNTSGGEYSFFKITTPDGIIYRFESLGYTFPNTEPSFISSWYLTQITHPCGDIISFNYTTVNLNQYLGVVQSATKVVAISGPSQYCTVSQMSENVNVIHTNSLFLDNITFQGQGSIVFERKLREDSYMDIG